jgi:hypothetical protein
MVDDLVQQLNDLLFRAVFARDEDDFDDELEGRDAMSLCLKVIISGAMSARVNSCSVPQW